MGDSLPGVRAPGRRLRGVRPALVLCALAAAPATASPPSQLLDPALLGASEAELRERVADLATEPVVSARFLYEQIRPPRAEPAETPAEAGQGAAGASEAARGSSPAERAARAAATPVASGDYADQLRLGRAVGSGDLARVSYDLFRGRVYRLRAQLAARFERPVSGPLVGHLRARLGPPTYDQTLKAKLGSSRSDLRRVGWQLGELSLELRQLHPLTGGPVFLSLADRARLQAIVGAHGVVMPEPETTGDWWRRPQSIPQLPTTTELEGLLAGIDVLLDSLGLPEAPPDHSPAP